MSLKYTNSNDDSITFDGTTYLLIDFEGLGGIPTNLQLQKAPFQDGSSYIDSLLEDRAISIEGVLVGSNVATLRTTMMNVFNPKLSGTLQYTYDSLNYSVDVYIDQPPVFLSGTQNKGPAFQRFTLSLIAPDPLWYAPAAVYTLSASFSAVNSGDVACPVEVIYEADGAAIVDPKITNSTTGEYIGLDYSLADGADLYINTAFGKKEIKLVADNTNLYQYLVTGSTMFWLEPGTHTITVEVTSGTIAGELRLYNRYLGV